MSYSYLGKFVDVKNHKIVVTADVSFLKNINQYSYRCELNDVTPTGTAKSEDFPEVTTEFVYHWEGYFDKSVLTSDFKEYKKDRDAGTGCPTGNAYYIDENVFDKEKCEPFKAYVNYNELLKPDFFKTHPDIISLYIKSRRKIEGQWYRYEDFQKAGEKIKAKYLDALKRVHKLQLLKDSKEWFEMSDKAQERFYEENSCAEEALEDAEIEYWTIEKIINIFDFLQEDCGSESVDEYDEIHYTWNYDDHRSIELFIEVC